MYLMYFVLWRRCRRIFPRNCRSSCRRVRVLLTWDPACSGERHRQVAPVKLEARVARSPAILKVNEWIEATTTVTLWQTYWRSSRGSTAAEGWLVFLCTKRILSRQNVLELFCFWLWTFIFPLRIIRVESSVTLLARSLNRSSFKKNKSAL